MWGPCFDKQKNTALCCSKCSIFFGVFFPKTKEALKPPFWRNYGCIKNARSKMTEQLQHILFSNWWIIQASVEVNLWLSYNYMHLVLLDWKQKCLNNWYMGNKLHFYKPHLWEEYSLICNKWRIDYSILTFRLQSWEGKVNCRKFSIINN